jgi:hypothetical protein
MFTRYDYVIRAVAGVQSFSSSDVADINYCSFQLVPRSFQSYNNRLLACLRFCFSVFSSLLFLPLTSVFHTLGDAVEAALEASTEVAQAITDGTASLAGSAGDCITYTASCCSRNVADGATQAAEGVAEGTGDELASVSGRVTSGVAFIHFVEKVV